jgi:hypothetical protein
MSKVATDLLMAVDRGKPSSLLSLDIRVAFDMLIIPVCYSEPLNSSDLMTRLNWLKSYLTDCVSCVSIGNCRSATVSCTTGVPQGSVLGPLLFSIFTTPVGRLISTLNISYHQYADDSQL